tara:strand:+ start:22 stop:258 length:237 start_codon:yes stop_codon:yes gene_type:complete
MGYTLGLSFDSHEDYEKIRDLLITFSANQGGTYSTYTAKDLNYVDCNEISLESDFVIDDLEALRFQLKFNPQYYRGAE